MRIRVDGEHRIYTTGFAEMTDTFGFLSHLGTTSPETLKSIKGVAPVIV
jgi:hypothetical protein